MEIVDLSIDDPEIKGIFEQKYSYETEAIRDVGGVHVFSSRFGQGTFKNPGRQANIEQFVAEMENAKQVRKMFNDLKKYVPFLQFIFDLDPITNSKYKTLINWLKIRNHATLDRWHVVSCESTIKRRYEKLQNTTNFPTHIKEIFEGGISIVISDEEDSPLPASASLNYKREENLKNYTEPQNKNAIHKQQSLSSSIQISQRREGDKADETLSTKGNSEQLFNAHQKTSLQTSSKISSKRRSSKHHKDSTSEKKETNTNNVDAGVFECVPLNDLKEEDEKSLIPKNLPCKEQASGSHTQLSKNDRKTESDERKKKNYKHSPKKDSKNASEIEHKSYESLIKQRKKLKKLLVNESEKIKPTNNIINTNLEKLQQIELFQRRESTMSERTVPFMNIVTNHSKSNIHQLQTKIIDSRVIDGIMTRNINLIENIASKTPETNNNCTEGDEYRKAMYEQQLNLQYQDSIQQFPQQNLEGPSLHRQNKISYNSSVFKKSKQDILKNSSISNKKSQQISAKTHGDHRRTSNPVKNNQSQSTDFDMNTQKLNSSETRGKSTEIKTKQKTSCPEIFGTISNDDPDTTGIHSSSFEKAKRNVVTVKSKAKETSYQSCSSSNSMKSTPGKSNNCDSKSSKPKPTSVNNSKEIEIPILFKKDEARKSSEHKTIKLKHDSVSTKLNSMDKSSKHDQKTKNPKNDSDRDQVIDLKLKEQKCKYESRKNDGSQTKKRKHSVNQDHCSSKPKLLKIGNVSKKSDGEIANDCTPIDQEKSSERRKVKNKSSSNKNTDTKIKVKENSDTIQKESKRKTSIESTNKIIEPSEKKTKISTLADKELVLTSKKITDSPVGGLEEVSKRIEANTKDISNTKGLKRKYSVESTKEVNNTSSKKLKISTQPNNSTTPKKVSNSPSRRFYRELNNLSCTFKESLLPQTVRRRRCSSSWLNLSENVDKSLKSTYADFKPVPIQRRRQTCSAMPNLKLTLQRSSERNNEYCIKGIENDISSDETDEFDIDEHRYTNKKKPNSDINEREVESNVNSCFKTMDSPYEEMPRLIPFDSIDSQSPTKPPGNNDSKMTFKSTRSCVLCNKNSNDLTYHYVVKHKTESYVSRLSSTDIRKLEKEKTVAIPVCRNRYRITCVFCKQMVEDHFENFYAHFSYHTGEYSFQCDGCNIKKPYKEDIGSHQLRSRVCMNSKINKIHHNELETTIYLHICKICNFVNLNEINLKNHLRKQHDLVSNEHKNSKKCILLVKDISKIVKVPTGFEGNNCEADNTPADLDSPLCAEKDFICELPMDIKNILMDEDSLKKCDLTIERHKAIDSSLSPEDLLEVMHAPNNAKNTIPESVLGESTCKSHPLVTTDIHAKDNLNRSVTSGEASGYTNKILFCDLRASETLTSIITAALSSKKHAELGVEKKNASDCSSIEQNLDKIPVSRSENKNSFKDLHDLESLTSIQESTNSTEKIFCQGAKEQILVINSSNTETCNSPAAKINLEKLRSSKSFREEPSQCIEKYFEDFHDSESLSSIEAYIKSTESNEILCPDSETRTLNLHDSNSTSIINSLNENLLNSPERDLGKPYASYSQLATKILPQTSIEPEINSSSPQYKPSMIYRQYDKFDPNNFGLFKCLIEDCSYTTNSEEEFKTHWSNHNQTKILDCPYCFAKSSCLENVIDHIWDEQSMSNYQCVKCSYRSIVPGNVKLHSRIFHNDIKANESIYKCGYLKTSKETKYKAMPKKPRDNVACLKCPDCSNSFFSKASIKSHLKKSHPINFQRFSSLNLNELACIHCNQKSNCKEMQIHLALQHPDEPGFVIERKLKPEECEDGVEDLIVADICIDVLETDIRISKENKSLNIADLNEDQEALNTMKTEPKQLLTVNNTQVSTISTVMPLDSLTKSCRSPGNCTISHQPEPRSEESSTNNPTKSPLLEKKYSSTELKEIDETHQTRENCLDKLTESDAVYSDNCESQQNEQSQTLDDIGQHIEEVQNNLHIQSQNESNEPVQSMLIDSIQLDHLEHERLEVPFESSSHNFSEAVVKEGERISSLLELLVENTGVHSSSLYKCPHCDLSFRHFELWLTHMKNKHRNIQGMHCPYCTKQFEIDTAESHFKYHLRHKYICYYCITSCCSKEKIQEHFASCHGTCTTIEWPITSFYLVIKQDAIISDYVALLEHFAEAIYLHLTKKIQQNTVNEWTVKLTDSYLDEMEIPQYKPDGQSLFKCFMKLCPYVASNENSFDDHLFHHELPKTFECKYCEFLIAYPSWESIKCHHLQHLSPSLYVCCVCKFVHFSNEGMIKHIENLHNSRDVPVLCLLRGDLDNKVSLSIFLPPNKISFTTSKACFCCTEELINCNKYFNHLKKVHKLSLCPRCQLCSKIILTHLDGEAHFKEDHQIESFKLKYEILTTYLYNLILTSRSPLIMEIRLQKEKCSHQEIESNSHESSSVAVKEEISVKSELEEDKQTESISIKCLHTNQLMENEYNTFPQPHQRNDIDVNSIQQTQTFFVNHDGQHLTGDMIIENTSRPSEPQNSASSTQHQQLQVTTEITNSSQEHAQPSTDISLPLRNTVQYSSQKQATAREVPLLPQISMPHSTPTTAAARCFLQSETYSHSLRSSQSQSEGRTETLTSNCTLLNPGRDSLPSKQTQHIVIKKIQLTTGNAILSIPLEASKTEKARIEEESQSIPVITTRVAQPNIRQIPAPPQSIPTIPNMQTYTRPLSNTIAQVSQINKPNIDEIAPICGTCELECVDFTHLQSHYEETHAIYNHGFYFYVDRKICCMYCRFQCSVSSLAQHHATFHLDRKKLCQSILDPRRCGICNGIFRYQSSPSTSKYSLPPLCACPGNKRALADCLTLPILKTLQNIGYQYYKYACDVCKLPLQSPQQLVRHYYTIHNQYIDPEVWRARLKYYCCMCASMVSYSIYDIIYHMRFSHLITLGLTLFQRFEFYKRIRIAYPNGLLVSLDDLRNTGQFNAEIFKQKIYDYEAQYT